MERERHERRPQSAAAPVINKATVEKPWVYRLTPETAAKAESLKALAEIKLIRTPVQKRSLFILSPAIAADNGVSNIGCFTDGGNDSAVISNLAMSIAAAPSAILSHLDAKDLSLQSFGRIIVFDTCLKEEAHNTFIANVSAIVSQIKIRNAELILYTDNNTYPEQFAASETVKDWKAPVEKEKDEQETSAREIRKEQRTDDRKAPKKELDDAAIQALYKKMSEFDNPEKLEKIRQLVKKNVPMMRRSYFAAYLLLMSENRRPQREERNDRRDSRRDGERKSAPRAEKSSEQKPRAAKPEGKSLYINLGAADLKTGELVKFICEKSGIAEEQITGITMKGTYTFFYVKDEVAEKAAKAIDGQTYGEKTLKCNGAKDSKNASKRPSQPKRDFNAVEETKSEN